MKSKAKNNRKLNFHIDGKKGNFNKAPFTATLKIYQYRNSTPLLIEVERHVVSEHLPDDPD